MKETHPHVVLKYAYQLAKDTNADALLVISEKSINKSWLTRISKKIKVIIAFPKNELSEKYKQDSYKVMTIPFSGLSRFSRIRHILLFALSKNIIKGKDKIVCVSGSALTGGLLDSITTLHIANQFKEITAFKKYSSGKKIQLVTIESVLNIALELGAFGREKDPIGAIFIIGDTKNVLTHSKQLIFNPFKGYKDKDKNIKNPQVKESICELARIDGAFIVRSNGVLSSAGRLLVVPKSNIKIHPGLGARHNAAAYMTKKTDSIGIVVSESTGSVSGFIKGKLLFRFKPRIGFNQHI